MCGRDVEEFLPLDSFYIENRQKYGNPYPLENAETLNVLHYQCPHCGASDRDRLYALYIAGVLDRGNSDRGIELLDFAPSRPLQVFLQRIPCIKYRSADKYMDGVDIVIDIMDMSPIASSTFDLFICSHVLEHVYDDRQALSELHRILRPGGTGILMVPIMLGIDAIDEDPNVVDTGERWRRFGQDDHVRLYSKKGFMQRVRAAGFKLRSLGVGFFGSSTFLRHGITPQSVLYIVEKSRG